ncbi:hypothetical protein D3C86_1989550 [compost metagenome]
MIVPGASSVLKRTLVRQYCFAGFFGVATSTTSDDLTLEPVAGVGVKAEALAATRIVLVAMAIATTLLA